VKIQAILDTLRTRKLKFGGYTTLIVLAAVAIAIVVNLLADQIPWKADLTEYKIYSLSEQTKTLLSGLTSDITITTLSKVNQEDQTVKEVLSNYALASKHIKLQTMDPEKNPGWVKQYDKSGSGLSAGTLIVAGPKEFKTIGPYDMYNIDYQSYYSGQSSSPQVTSLAAEQRIDSAIQFVTSGENPAIYVLQGHGEETLSGMGLATSVENQNYVVKELTLLSAQTVPADTDVLLALSPKTDYSAQEVEAIKSYMSKGGRAIFIIDIADTPGTRYTNLDSLFASFGVKMDGLLVIEGDSTSFALGRPHFLVPNLGSNDIVAPIDKAGFPILFPVSQGIETLPLKKASITIEPLLISSANSWGRADYVNITSSSKERGDVEGPFNLAVAITDKSSDPNVKDARLVLMGSSQFLTQQIITQLPGNSDLLMNSLGWLSAKNNMITVSPKYLQSFPLNLNGVQALLFSGIAGILIPLAVFGLGLGVWLRRRHL
jgi:ABC-2 type transport system permease protein